MAIGVYVRRHLAEKAARAAIVTSAPERLRRDALKVGARFVLGDVPTVDSTRLVFTVAGITAKSGQPARVYFHAPGEKQTERSVTVESWQRRRRRGDLWVLLPSEIKRITPITRNEVKRSA